MTAALENIPQGPVVVASEDRMNGIARQRLEISGIPPEYLKYSIIPEDGYLTYDFNNPKGDICPSKKQAYYACCYFIRDIHLKRQNGLGIFLYGEPNQKLGMSLLGSFIIKAAIEEGYSGLYVPFSTFCDDLDYQSNELESKELYRTVDFLMIDSVSRKSIKSPKVIDGFADIILNRRKNKLPTIFSSYISPDILGAIYSESLISYFEDFMEKYEIKHESELDVDKQYDMNRLINFFQEAKKIKSGYAFWEIEDLLKRFKTNYGYFRS